MEKLQTGSLDLSFGLVRESQLLVESICLRFSAEELNQSCHFILTAPLFEHGVAVPTTLFGVHRIFLENGVEHVG
jgi:hypothetical protein